MEFFRIKRDIPFMRHALTFNVISLVTFLLAVVFLATKGLNLGVDFRGGTVIEVTYSHPVDFNRVRAAIDKLNLGEYSAQSFGRSDTALIRLPLKEGTSSAALSERVMAELEGRRPLRHPATRGIRGTAGGHANSTRTAHSRCSSFASASSRISRCASSGASPSRRSSRTCTT